MDYSNEKKSVGTRAEFYCNQEYELTGPPIAVCLAKGEWNVTTPECLGKSIEYSSQYPLCCLCLLDEL